MKGSGLLQMMRERRGGKGKEGWVWRKERRPERGRREVLFIEVLKDFKTMAMLGGETRPSPSHQSPEKCPAAPMMFIPLRGKHLGQELMAPLCSGSSCSLRPQPGLSAMEEKGL